MADWFAVGDRWHAVKDPRRDRTVGRCGVVVLGVPHSVRAPDDDPYPPGACAACKREVAFDDVEEESMTDARARGHLPAPKDSE